MSQEQHPLFFPSSPWDDPEFQNFLNNVEPDRNDSTPELREPSSSRKRLREDSEPPADPVLHRRKRGRPAEEHSAITDTPGEFAWLGPSGRQPDSYIPGSEERIPDTPPLLSEFGEELGLLRRARDVSRSQGENGDGGRGPSGSELLAAAGLERVETRPTGNGRVFRLQARYVALTYAQCFLDPEQLNAGLVALRGRSYAAYRETHEVKYTVVDEPEWTQN